MANKNPNESNENCASKAYVSTDGHYFMRGGKRFFPIGINYLPSYLCGNHFEDYRAQHICADLDHISEMGLNCVRVAVFWAGFEPKQGQFNQDFLQTFKTFVAECKKRQILVIPVFLIGTWTGMYDAPYYKPPGMYQGEMLELEAKHVAEFARHFADDPTILAWDLSDEPWYLEEIPPSPPRTALGLPPRRRDIATNWVATLAAAIREVDPNHMITLGCDPEPVRKDTGFALEEIAEHLDVMSYCIYPLPSYGIELGLIAYGAFQTRFFAAGIPSFLHEGPGISSCAASEQILADRSRAWMYSSLANGNTGVLPWCYTDYEKQQHYCLPLDDRPQEPNFGICFADRTLKPRGRELLKFAADVRRLPLDDLKLEPPRAAFIYPYDFYEKSGRLHDKLWHHFTIAKGANINGDLVREDFLPSDASLLIVPGFQLLLSTWAKLTDFVKAGGNLLMIMDDFFCLNPLFSELFGVTVEGLRAGAVNAKLDKQWGSISKGSKFTFNDKKIERLWVKPDNAETIASFDDGYPFFLANSFGKGKAYLATFPFSLYLDLGEPQNQTCTSTVQLLKALRDLAGCQPPIETDLHWVETAIFRSTSNGDDFALIINFDRSVTDGTITIKGDYSAVLDAEDKPLPAKRDNGKLGIPVNLIPNDVRLWRLSRA